MPEGAVNSRQAGSNLFIAKYPYRSEEIFCCPVLSRVPACDIQYLKSHVKNYSNQQHE